MSPDRVSADYSDYGTNQDVQFKLVDVTSGESIAVLELPHDVTFLGEITKEDTTFNVRGAERMTLVPVDDLVEESLRLLYDSLLSLDEPTRFSHILQQKQDGIVNQLQYTFGCQPRIIIQGKDDLLQYLDFVRGAAKSYKPKVVQRRKLGKLASFVDGLIKKKAKCGCGAPECHAEADED